MKNLELINIVNSSDHFSANGWSFEVAKKYLFSINGKIIEAGFYTHYTDETMVDIVKQVIELPTSYGCQMRCVYCASSNIKNISPCKTDDLIGITDYLFSAHNISSEDKMLISLTGTGDAYFTINLISEYILTISNKYSNLCFTVSSCSWTNKMLRTIEKLSEEFNIRTIQATFITLNENKLQKIIPGLNSSDFAFSTFVDYVSHSSLRNWRINYIMLHTINDSDEDFTYFINFIQPIKDKIVVRISSLNETIASKSNNLRPSAIERSKFFHNMLYNRGIKSYLFNSVCNNNMSCGQLVLEHVLIEDNNTD